MGCSEADPRGFPERLAGGAGVRSVTPALGWLRIPGMDKSLVGIASSKLNDPYGELKIFSGQASGHLAGAICSKLGIDLARSETHVFSEGNVFVRVLENVRGRDVFIVQGT